MAMAATTIPTIRLTASMPVCPTRVVSFSAAKHEDVVDAEHEERDDHEDRTIAIVVGIGWIDEGHACGKRAGTGDDRNR